MADDVNINKTDEVILAEDVVRLFHLHFSESLDILSSRFPHRQGDRSQNETEYNGLRAKILRSGNNKLRDLPKIFSDYRIIKVRDTVTEIKTIASAMQNSTNK